MVQALTELLPAGGQQSQLTGSASGDVVSGGLTYRNGSTTSIVLVVVSLPAHTTHQSQAAGCNADRLANGTVTHRNDGSTIVLVGGVEQEAFFCRPDGVDVAVYEKTPNATAAIAAAELAAIATSDRWQPKVSAAEAARAAHLFTVKPQTSAPGSSPSK